MKKISAFLIIFSIFSCKTVEVNQQRQQMTKTVIELGVIGKVNKGIEINTFQTTTVPVYKEKIRVSTNILVFNDNTFNTYAQAALQQNRKIKITYIDSVANKPGYVNFQILDKVQLLSELNAPHNTDVNNYLQNANNNVLITGMTVYFDAIELSNVSQAEEVYLINNKPKKYSLELVKSGKSFANVDLSKAVPFAYTTASFCWKKEHGKISIANMIDQSESCARNTYKNVARLNKKIDYFKY